MKKNECERVSYEKAEQFAELLADYASGSAAYCEFGFAQDLQVSQDCKAELLSRLEAGEKAIQDLKRIKGCFDELEYHRFGMGCGLEDRDIIDRYEAMEYGWERAIEQVAEIITPRFG